MTMELKDYTTEELKAELKRRAEINRAQKAEEMKTALQCRNCKHCLQNPNLHNSYLCAIWTWGKKISRHYVVTLSRPACELFERKPL